MDSIWTENVELPRFPQLKGNRKTDVLIVGGGLTGILCAWFLEQEGIDYCLVEVGRICGGVTCDTTAKITSQHGLIYQKLVKEFGFDEASLYLQANENALQQYRKMCSQIECDFEEKDAYVYATENPFPLLEEMEVLEKLGFDAKYEHRLILPIQTIGAVRFPHQAQFHPLKFVSKVAENLKIYEYTKVKEFVGRTVKTEFGIITANEIIMATHFPILNKHGMYFLKMYQSRSYVLALQNAQQVDGMYIDAEKNGLSFRNYGDFLLLGGGGHRTGKKGSGEHRTGKKGGGWNELRAFAQEYYPSAKEVMHFATQDCMTLDQVPYIGRYGKKTEDLFVATGFNKWGMTSSMAAAMTLRDLIVQGKSEYEKLFNPQRTMMRSQLWINGAEAVCNLVSFRKKRCPHMGCSLRWNQEEATWDCPCHGSRFAQNGELIDNPATDDLKK